MTSPPEATIATTSPKPPATVYCQVDECGADLKVGETFKPYHRRNKVCDKHMKSLIALVKGRSCRYCQQCHKFHEVAAFEGKKHSCIEKLLRRAAHWAPKHPVAPTLQDLNMNMISGLARSIQNPFDLTTYNYPRFVSLELPSGQLGHMYAALPGTASGPMGPASERFLQPGQPQALMLQNLNHLRDIQAPDHHTSEVQFHKKSDEVMSSSSIVGSLRLLASHNRLQHPPYLGQLQPFQTTLVGHQLLQAPQENDTSRSRPATGDTHSNDDKTPTEEGRSCHRGSPRLDLPTQLNDLDRLRLRGLCTSQELGQVLVHNLQDARTEQLVLKKHGKSINQPLDISSQRPSDMKEKEHALSPPSDKRKDIIWKSNKLDIGQKQKDVVQRCHMDTQAIISQLKQNFEGSMEMLKQQHNSAIDRMILQAQPCLQEGLQDQVGDIEMRQPLAHSKDRIHFLDSADISELSSSPPQQNMSNSGTTAAAAMLATDLPASGHPLKKMRLIQQTSQVPNEVQLQMQIEDLRKQQLEHHQLHDKEIGKLQQLLQISCKQQSEQHQMHNTEIEKLQSYCQNLEQRCSDLEKQAQEKQQREVGVLQAHYHHTESLPRGAHEAAGTTSPPRLLFMSHQHQDQGLSAQQKGQDVKLVTEDNAMLIHGDPSVTMEASIRGTPSEHQNLPMSSLSGQQSMAQQARAAWMAQSELVGQGNTLSLHTNPQLPVMVFGMQQQESNNWIWDPNGHPFPFFIQEGQAIGQPILWKQQKQGGT